MQLALAQLLLHPSAANPATRRGEEVSLLCAGPVETISGEVLPGAWESSAAVLAATRWSRQEESPPSAHVSATRWYHCSESLTVLFQRFSVKQPFCFWLQRTRASLRACIVNIFFSVSYNFRLQVFIICFLIMSALKIRGYLNIQKLIS